MVAQIDVRPLNDLAVGALDLAKGFVDRAAEPSVSAPDPA